MRDLIFKYLNRNYSIIKYDKSSLWPPKNGCLLYSKYLKTDVSWGNVNRDISVIFSVHLADVKYVTNKWFDEHAAKLNGYTPTAYWPKIQHIDKEL